MIGSNDKALIEWAVIAYPEMLLDLLAAMRTYQRNDEPARAGTTPATLPLALACVLAVRMADNPDALKLAAALFAGGLALQRGEVLPGQVAEMAQDVLSSLEERGVI